jgi:ERF superfamily
MGGSPQAMGAAITYARRYALCAATGLAPGGDENDRAESEYRQQAGAELARAGAETRHHAAAKPRSRTGTNASLRAEGRMDRAQAGEHDKLKADTLREPRRAERSRPRRPEPSAWDTDAPVDHDRAAALREELNGADLSEPEDKPGSILPGQKGAVERLLTIHLGKQATRGDKHAYLSDLLNVPVESLNDLSASLAGEAIRGIQADIDAEKSARV